MISGVTFEWVSASTIQMVPSGPDGKARIPVWNGSTLLQIVLSQTLTMDISTTGIGGLDTGSEGASKGYDIYLITKDDGSGAALIAVLTGNGPTLPSGNYTHISPLLWFIHNDSSSDIVEFRDLGNGQCEYVGVDGSTDVNGPFGIRILDAFVGTDLNPAAALDFTEAIPNAALDVTFMAVPGNPTGTSRTWKMGTDPNLASTTEVEPKTLLAVSADVGILGRIWNVLKVPIKNGPSDSVYHGWNNTPTGTEAGTYIDVQGWTIDRNTIAHEPPGPVTTILAIQQAASFDHIYDFEFGGSPLTDKGSGGANLTIPGTLTHAAPTVDGTLGSYENLTNFSQFNTLATSASSVNMARTADVFYEGIWELPTTPVGGNSVGLATVGTFTAPAGNSWLYWNGSLGYVQLSDQNFTLRISATGLTASYLNAPTYIAVWWDHANTVLRMYYKKAGQPETALVSGSFAASSAGNAQLWIGGNSANIYSVKAIVHMFGLKRGALTADHRNSIYAAMGIS